MSIFVNGFTLEGASAVGSGDDLDEFEAFDVLASLVDKSLVLAEPDGDALRYRLLESTRAYAREKLEAAGERERSAERHLRFLRDRYAALEERFETTARQTELKDAFAPELDDIRAALEFGLHGDNVPVGAALLAATGFRAWRAVGLDHEGMAREESYLAALSRPEQILRARLWTCIANIASNLGRKTRALEAATQAVACARACGDARVLSAALRQYAPMLSRDDAETILAEAEALPDPSAAQRLYLLQTRAELSALRGDPEVAVRATERLLKEHRLLGNTGSVRLATLNLAEWTHAAGETGRAIELVRDVLPACRDAGDRNLLANVMTNLAGYLAAADQFSEASAVAREVIRELTPREPAATFIAIALEPLALALAIGGDLARAANVAGYADAALRAQGCEREFTETTTRDRLSALLAERLAPDDLARRLAEGAALSPEAAIALALDEP